jgi:hypothetical protein
VTALVKITKRVRLHLGDVTEDRIVHCQVERS